MKSEYSEIKKDTTKENILNVAAKIFSKFGFKKTTIEEIASSARKAKGSVYYYFKNKEDLFKEVVNKEFQVLQTELTKVINEDIDSDKKFKKFVLIRMQTLNNSVNFYDVLKNNYFNHLAFVEQIREKYDKEETNFVKNILNQGIKNKQFQIENVNLTANAIEIALKGLEIPLFLNNEFNELESRLDELINIFVRGIEKR